MRWSLPLALITALAAQTSAPGPLVLELRAFDGVDEVTSDIRVTVHRAGERGDPLARSTSSEGRIELTVPSGLYDIQAIHERDGRVIDIRWVNRVVVMPYPDEHGRHLEVINFKNGFGALEVRGPSDVRPDVGLFESGKHDKPIAPATGATRYTLFVVPAGRYDVLAHATRGAGWQTGIDVPLDRTRLWLIP